MSNSEILAKLDAQEREIRELREMVRALTRHIAAAGNSGFVPVVAFARSMNVSVPQLQVACARLGIKILKGGRGRGNAARISSEDADRINAEIRAGNYQFLFGNATQSSLARASAVKREGASAPILSSILDRVNERAQAKAQQSSQSGQPTGAAVSQDVRPRNLKNTHQ